MHKPLKSVLRALLAASAVFIGAVFLALAASAGGVAFLLGAIAIFGFVRAVVGRRGGPEFASAGGFAVMAAASALDFGGNPFGLPLLVLGSLLVGSADAWASKRALEIAPPAV
jgi:hypothetical protein